MGWMGNQMRSAFEMIFKDMGQTIVVHNNFNTPDASSYETRGMKGTEGNNSKQVIFNFLEQLDIQVGSVLQVKGGRDYWRVNDTEDIIHDDTFIKFKARVEKINQAGQPTRLPASSVATHKTEISIINSTVGILNTGEIEDIQSISVNVSALNEAGHAEMAKALKELTKAVVANVKLPADERSYVLENLEELSRQASLPPDARAKSGVIKSLVGGVGSSLSAAGGLAEVWSTWGATIRAFFGL